MLNTFVSQDNKDPLVCAMPVTVYARDRLMRVRRDYGGPTISFHQAMKKLGQKGEVEEEEEQLPISQLRATRERLESRSLFLPSLWSTPRGKCLRLSPASSKRKGRTKASAGGAPKKAKLLVSVLSAARAGKVYFELFL